MSQTLRAAITSVGGYVPETKLTNFDLEKMVDTNDEWIRSRTGISERRILIDSCLQHAAAALGLKSTVLWVSTSPGVFGYPLHDNIKGEIPEGVKLPDSYLFDYNFHGLNHECPITDLNIFDIPTIISTL